MRNLLKCFYCRKKQQATARRSIGWTDDKGKQTGGFFGFKSLSKTGWKDQHRKSRVQQKSGGRQLRELSSEED